MIPVTRPYFPSREKLSKYIDGIYQRQWLTNSGPLVEELTKRLEAHLGVKNLLLVANGTLALQIAYRALGVSDRTQGAKPEAITTPFTYIATASSMKWEGVQPVFVDIDSSDWCLDPKNVEASITPNTRAIIPVHVFGNACDVEEIDEIAARRNIKVIYDACHAFGVKYRGESLLKFGDAATLSFHATKLFHTAEGGAIIFKRREDLDRAKKMINFGLSGPETIEELGVNAKMNELQAAMGLCVLDEMDANMNNRLAIWEAYKSGLGSFLQMQKLRDNLSYNAAYFACVFESEKKALKVEKLLKENGIMARRYFYPSLETIKIFGIKDRLPISSSIARRILCLPIYSGLKSSEQKMIIDIVKG
jgi:dTDP-4-amino-4,6-dideoxygalactose transaminase